MVEGTLEERDAAYRKKMHNGWIALDEDTDFLHVPGGMVLRSMGKHMVFVPCDAYDRRDWLKSQGV